MSEELKPCAHCGGAATENVNKIGGGGVYSTVVIRCKPCNYEIARSGRVGMTIDELRAEVAAIWNRRAPVEIDDAMVDRAKGAYAMYTGWHIDLVDWDGMQTALAAALNNEEGKR